MSDTPIATITVGDTTFEREVCSIELRTRGGKNILRLTGGVDICVADDVARAVFEQYYGCNNDGDDE